MLKFIILLIVTTFAIYPCRNTEAGKQYTTCGQTREGRNFVVIDGTTSAANCADECSTAKSSWEFYSYENFGNEKDCRCLKCGSSVPPQGSADVEHNPDGQVDDTVRLYSQVETNAKCEGGTESSNTCENGVAGTRCVADSNCGGGLTCCENYKICASGSGSSTTNSAYKKGSTWYKWGGSDWDQAITNFDNWACSVNNEMAKAVAVSQTSCDGMPLWAYGMFALLTLNPIILLWTRQEKGDAYKNLLDEE